MWRYLGIAAILAVFAQGCATRPGVKSVSSDSFFRVDYQSWSCQQLAEETSLLKDALEVATLQQSDPRPSKSVARLQQAVDRSAPHRT